MLYSKLIDCDTYIAALLALLTTVMAVTINQDFPTYGFIVAIDEAVSIALGIIVVALVHKNGEGEDFDD